MNHIVLRSAERFLRFVVPAGMFWLLIPAVPATFAAEAEVNHCVECHEKEALPISLGHSFTEWKASSHAKSGVSCEKCHGGDPKKSDPAEAHKDVLPATDPKSLVSSERIAAMCGSCHEKEHKAFLSTVHAEPDDEDRATCMTCHGSMATSLPTPAELRTRCAVCHDKPVEAQASLAVLANAKIQLYRTARNLASVRDRDPKWHEGAITRLHELERSFGTIQLEWHTFEMKKVLHDSMNVLKLSKLLDEEARLRANLPPAPPAKKAPTKP